MVLEHIILFVIVILLYTLSLFSLFRSPQNNQRLPIFRSSFLPFFPFIVSKLPQRHSLLIRSFLPFQPELNDLVHPHPFFITPCHLSILFLFAHLHDAYTSLSSFFTSKRSKEIST